MANEKDLKTGLTKLAGGRKASEVIQAIREGREPTWLEKRKIVSEKPSEPLTQPEIQAIQAYLGVKPATGESGKK